MQFQIGKALPIIALITLSGCAETGSEKRTNPPASTVEASQNELKPKIEELKQSVVQALPPKQIVFADQSGTITETGR